MVPRAMDNLGGLGEAERERFGSPGCLELVFMTSEEKAGVTWEVHGSRVEVWFW